MQGHEAHAPPLPAAARGTLTALLQSPHGASLEHACRPLGPRAAPAGAVAAATTAAAAWWCLTAVPAQAYPLPPSYDAPPRRAGTPPTLFLPDPLSVEGRALAAAAGERVRHAQRAWAVAMATGATGTTGAGSRHAVVWQEPAAFLGKGRLGRVTQAWCWPSGAACAVKWQAATLDAFNELWALRQAGRLLGWCWLAQPPAAASIRPETGGGRGRTAAGSATTLVPAKGPWLVAIVPLAPRTTMADLLDAVCCTPGDGPPVADLAAFLCSLQGEMAALHDRGIVHRDAHVHNVAWQRQPQRSSIHSRAHLLDFGRAFTVPACDAALGAMGTGDVPVQAEAKEEPHDTRGTIQPQDVVVRLQTRYGVSTESRLRDATFWWHRYMDVVAALRRAGRHRDEQALRAAVAPAIVWVRHVIACCAAWAVRDIDVTLTDVGSAAAGP